MPPPPKRLTGRKPGARLPPSVREMKEREATHTAATGAGSPVTQVRQLIQEGLDDVTAGRLVPMETARAWTDSLDTENVHPVAVLRVTRQDR
jgi:hypothetical protein